MTCACGNTARYVDASGALTCAICPIRAGVDSIKIVSVPALLAWARDISRGSESFIDLRRKILELGDIVGRPSNGFASNGGSDDPV